MGLQMTGPILCQRSNCLDRALVCLQRSPKKKLIVQMVLIASIVQSSTRKATIVWLEGTSKMRRYRSRTLIFTIPFANTDIQLSIQTPYINRVSRIATYVHLAKHEQSVAGSGAW